MPNNQANVPLLYCDAKEAERDFRGLLLGLKLPLSLIYIYVYRYTMRNIYTYMYIYICMYVDTLSGIYIHTCIYICMYICIHYIKIWVLPSALDTTANTWLKTSRYSSFSYINTYVYECI
jgi:hypothetical protein